MQPFDILVLAVATWYIAHLITRSDGPYAVFRKLREAMPMGGLLTCSVCASIWIATGCYILWMSPLQHLVYLPAIAGASLMAGVYSGATRLA